MKIDSLMIENFRGIRRLDAADLGDTIIIAGQNGSGKSCIFDAIRLLKSTYGGYQQNEWQQFFGEFAIQLGGGAQNIIGLFNDREKPITIECHFRIRDREKAFISKNSSMLLEETIWQTLLPEAFQFGAYRRALFANQFRERQPEVNERIVQELPGLQNELAQTHLIGKIIVQKDGQVEITPSRLLSVIFSNYRPKDLGVIDFHGAQRHYGREQLQGINLNLDAANQVQSQHTLYNYNNKYNNVKSEMAGAFVKELLAERAAPGASTSGITLTDTLRELFEAFFPEKTFLGPRPTDSGSLSFPVLTQSGTEHDLDELSSGEKEILYGYLRIRSSAPGDSIILLDEPELHLNPRLISGLPEFYRKHLGEALQNQLWLVTHSDALIRQAVGKPGLNVFHMLPCGAEAEGTSQLKPLTVTEDLEVVIADLVGDLAAYRPGGKGLIFEGGGGSDFDKTFTSALFPEEMRGVNLISGTNKIRVKLLHEVLDRAYKKGDLPTKFFAVVDMDSDDEVSDSAGINRFTWDVYHIENYLLDPAVISEVLSSLKLGTTTAPDAVINGLTAAARKVVPSMLGQKMRKFVNSKIVRSIDLSFDTTTTTIGKELHLAAARSVDQIGAAFSLELSEAALMATETEFRTEIEKSFADGTWLKALPGRDILKQYVSTNAVPVGYEAFRNLVVSKMREKGIKPEGMKSVIDKVVAG